jgi:HAE1 family hydrophobic/amphiphilic exporter-1
VTSIVGFNLLSSVQSTYTGFFFITLEEWSKRKTPELQVDAIQAHINRELAALPKPTASFAFPPPAIPGVGTAGGVTFILEVRSGADVEFIAKNTQQFMAAAKKRPELTNVFTTALWDVPQVYANVDKAQAMIQGVNLSDAYQTLQTFLGGYFVNYFNRFGLQWQVYIQAEGIYRTDIDNLGLFYVANKSGDSVPINSFVSAKNSFGPEFTMRYNMYRCSQINAAVTPGYSTGQAMQALEQIFHEEMPNGMGFDYLGMSFQEQKAAQGVPPSAIFGLSLLFVFLILAARCMRLVASFQRFAHHADPLSSARLPGCWPGACRTISAPDRAVVMLIGLAAKNAISSWNSPGTKYEKGKTAFEAALGGCEAGCARSS